MLLPPVVLALALGAAPQGIRIVEYPSGQQPLTRSEYPAQEAPPPVAPAPQDPSAVKAADLPAASAGPAQPHIDAGLAAFKRRRFSKAEIEFRKAMDAEPQSAAAMFYLGYTYYKMAEPSRRGHPDKQKALELFSKAFALDPQFTPVWRSAK